MTMIKQSKLRKSRSLQRMRRHFRVRNKVRGTAERPRLAVFRSLKNIEGQVIDDDTRRSIHSFFVIYIAWFVLGSLIMAALGLPFESALASVAATLNNIGPGLGLVGATQDFSHVPGVGKLFLSLCMVLGRLELFSICVLFVPGFWKHS